MQKFIFQIECRHSTDTVWRLYYFMTKKIGYSKTYPILSIGVWEKIWIEEEVPEETDTREVLYELKKQVENFHYESNRADEKKKEVSPEAAYFTTDDMQVPEITLEDQIKSCKSKSTLEKTYKFIIKGKPELETIYNNRLKELT